MTTSPLSQAILERLPKVRGRLSTDVSLADVTWFGVGGPADVVFKPADADDLANFLANKPNDIPTYVLGVGSNLLVRDGGIRGVVIRLGRAFTEVSTDGNALTCGAAALDASAARTAQSASIEGLEFLSGIPGTIGGAVMMNAGAYGHEIRDFLVWAEIMSPSGFQFRFTAKDLGMNYRHTDIPGDWIITKIKLRGQPGDKSLIAKRIEEIRISRMDSQPIRSRTGGSTFRNPPEKSAWELVEQAGCRGLKRGGAMVSDKHCNFLINTGDATASDIEELGEDVRQRVKDASGITLQWEIRRIGEPVQMETKA